MKNGLDRDGGAEPESPTNVVSLASARKRAAEEAKAKAKRAKAFGRGDDSGSRVSIGQWIVGGLFMLMAIGGAVALVSPLVKGASVATGLGIG
jgi:hypothetical protein